MEINRRKIWRTTMPESGRFLPLVLSDLYRLIVIAVHVHPVVRCSSRYLAAPLSQRFTGTNWKYVRILRHHCPTRFFNSQCKNDKVAFPFVPRLSVAVGREVRGLGVRDPRETTVSKSEYNRVWNNVNKKIIRGYRARYRPYGWRWSIIVHSESRGARARIVRVIGS